MRQRKASRRPYVATNRKLTFALAEEIRAKYTGPSSLAPLGAEYGVSRHTIKKIINGTNYTRPTRDELLLMRPAPTEASLDPLDLSDPRSVYRHEKEKRRVRSSVMAEARAAYEARLALDREAGKGGRPRKAPPTLTIKPPKPGKPQLVAVREDPRDVLWKSLGSYQG